MRKDDVLQTREYFGHVGLWPSAPTHIKPAGWLTNFAEKDLDHAIALLDAFVYFNLDLTNKIFMSSLHSLSTVVTATSNGYGARASAWSNFIESAFITYPEGETPRPTDSGYNYARRARQLLGFDEDHIVRPGDCLRSLKYNPDRPVIFVDDFAGSGQQFLTTWSRPDATAGGRSFESHSADNPAWVAYYIPSVATSYAIQKIAHRAPSVQVVTSHVLPATYNVASSNSVLIDDALRPTMSEFIIRYSKRLGCGPACALGFHGLGLALAFEHSVPDATIPLFYKEAPGWIPLLRRR